MNALDLVSGATQAVYVAVFVLVLWKAIRRPTPAHLDMTLLFGSVAFVIVSSRVARLVGPTLPAALTVIEVALIMAIPYFLLRLVADFTIVRRGLVAIVEVGLGVSVLTAVVFGSQLPQPVVLALVAYFAAVSIYCGARFIGAAHRAQGVTRRRFEAISLGSVLLAADLLVAGLAPFLPEPVRSIVSAAAQLAGLASSIAFYLGFTPPLVVKRAWQAPELHAFLARAAQLTRLTTTRDIVRELERASAAATGAQATIGLWDETRGVLRFLRTEPSSDVVDVRPGELAGGRAFTAQRPLFTADPVRDHPEGAEVYRASRVGAAIAVPITSGDRRLGVLCVYADRPPIFAVSDMELAQLLADQAATILEARALIDHAARVRAREEAARLKEDFLSAAAHDLKTPLTTVVAQAQFLERRALRDPGAPTDVAGIQRIAREGERLAGLVADLLDVARLEQRRLVGEREPVDLGSVASEVAARHDGITHPIQVDVKAPVVGHYDRRRVAQLIENLVENAAKYSPAATPVEVEVWQQDDTARIAVRDRGIGIPAADLQQIFDRFTRGSNVDDRRFHGMGLGLYICRGIAEEHGGRIWVESEVGQGSTFHVALPLGTGARMN